MVSPAVVFGCDSYLYIIIQKVFLSDIRSNPEE